MRTNKELIPNKMTKSLFLISLIMSFCVSSCVLKTDRRNFEHDYLKYWEKYSEQQLIDTLYADTLKVGPDNEEGWTSRDFYKKTTRELIIELQNNKSVDSLYPMTEFNELKIRKLPFGFSKTFSKEQTNKFLEIINDPVSFDWGETTYEPEYRINFLKDGKVVATITTAIQDMAIVKTEPNWPEFKRMKFGKIKSTRYQEFVEIINEIEK